MYLTEEDLETIAKATSEETSTSALEGAREHLYKAYGIPRIDKSVDELEKLVDSISFEVDDINDFGD